MEPRYCTTLPLTPHPSPDRFPRAKKSPALTRNLRESPWFNWKSEICERGTLHEVWNPRLGIETLPPAGRGNV